MFQQAHIQLPTEDQQTVTPPPLIKRSSSRWSIPCCSNFSIRGQRIQLPTDDSDEEEQGDFNDARSIASPFTMNFETNENNNNTFLQRSSNLSRNPFARVEEPTIQKATVPEQESEIVVEEEGLLFQQQQGEENVEELADFSRSSVVDKYANELDWTEMYQDEDQDSAKEEEEEVESNLNNQPTTVDTQRSNNTQEEEPASKEEEALISEDTEEELNIITKEEKIPQIDEQVLQYLPLPQLSNEIPPTLIHKKASFEKSMYGEAPLMSTLSSRPSSSSNNRISRFSMTEEDFMKLKKREEKEQKKKTVVIDQAIKVESSPLESINIKKRQSIVPEDAKQQQFLVTQQQRRSSIVATAAQSILGDKLDDFTEKLAFIKKNIIMSMDSDEEEEEADNAEQTLKKIAQMKKEELNSGIKITTTEETTRRPSLNHRRTSSLMDVAPSIARFMNQISGTVEDKEQQSSPPTSSTSTSFSPSSLFSALAGPMPETSSNKPSSTTTREMQQQANEDDEEELFDFTKVIEIGKNVKSFSEGFVGNGIRMFNDVAIRMKTAAEEEEREREEKEKKRASFEEEEEDHSNWLNDSYI